MDLKLLRDTPPWDWPEGADDLLLAVLSNPGAGREDRLLAAELAGDLAVVNDRLAGALLSIVCQVVEPEDLRGQAAISLGPALEDADTAFPEEGGAEDAISSALFDKVCLTFQRLYDDEKTPKLVRRRILEASVRAPRDWHQAAVRAAWAGDDEEWKLTALFCMGYVRGFGAEILCALESRTPEIRREAVRAAGEWGLASAWPHVSAIVTGGTADKDLLLAAIAAVATIRPAEAYSILGRLEGSDDEEVAEAASDALAESRAQEAGEDDEGDEEDEDDDRDDDADDDDEQDDDDRPA